MIKIIGSMREPPRGIRYGDMPWDGIIGGISSIVGAGISADAAKKAAKTQLQATRETNAANAKLAKEQNAWNWNAMLYENKWNSTAAQLERWKDAGLNPNSFAGVASPVEANAPQSADLANQVVPDVGALEAQAGAAWQSGLNNAASLLLQNKKLSIENKKADAEINNLDANSDFVRTQIEKVIPQQIKESESRSKQFDEQVTAMRKSYAEIQARIENYYAQANLADTKSNDIKVNQRFLKETWEDQKMSYYLNNALMRANIGLTSQKRKNLIEELNGILIENGTKATEFSLKQNELVMTEVTNWIQKIQALSSTYQFMSDAEKMQATAELFDALNGALSIVSTPSIPLGAYRASEKQKRRNYVLKYHLDQAPSFVNPSY